MRLLLGFLPLQNGGEPNDSKVAAIGADILSSTDGDISAVTAET